MKKTTFKRLLSVFALLSLLFSVFCLVSAAEEQIESENVNNSSQTEDTTEPEASTDSKETPGADAESETEVSPFSLAFDYVKHYATEIFCALSLICSVALSLAYKRGLIPAITGTLSALHGSVEKIKSTAEGESAESRELFSALTERLDGFAKAIEEAAERLSRLDGELAALGADAKERERQRLILTSQTDMLYSVFMSSSLPQYQKDEISKRVAAMREALSDGEGE